jgi:hypothetical protein
VGDHDDRGTGELLLLDDVHQQPAVNRVKPLRGLIQDEQLRIVHDRHTELDLLLLAAGELVQPDSGLLGEAHPLQIGLRPGACMRFAEALEPAEVDHHIQDVFLLVQAPLFRQVAQPRAVPRFENLPADVERPGRGLVDAQQRPQCGGLP